MRDVATLNERDAFDLVTAFDAIHDQAQPRRVLTNIACALRGEGLGTMWGEEQARQLLAEGGFASAQVANVEADGFNNHFIARKG